MIMADIGEGIVHEASVAPVIAELFRTIHKILLAQRNQLARLSEILSFKGSSLKREETFSYPNLGRKILAILDCDM